MKKYRIISYRKDLRKVYMPQKLVRFLFWTYWDDCGRFSQDFSENRDFVLPFSTLEGAKKHLKDIMNDSKRDTTVEYEIEI